MKPSPEVAQAVKVIFGLKENPKPSDFIIKVSLKDSELASIEGPHVAFTVSPLMVVPPPIDNASLETIASPTGHLSAV